MVVLIAEGREAAAFAATPRPFIHQFPNLFRKTTHCKPISVLTMDPMDRPHSPRLPIEAICARR